LEAASGGPFWVRHLEAKNGLSKVTFADPFRQEMERSKKYYSKATFSGSLKARHSMVENY